MKKVIPDPLAFVLYSSGCVEENLCPHDFLQIITDVPLFKTNTGTLPNKVTALIFGMAVAFIMFMKKL